MAVFDSKARCDEMRATIKSQLIPMTQPQTTGTRTVHRKMTFTCQEGGSTP
jgi:hypothetical protein